MKVTQEKKANLSLEVKVHIEKSDYEPRLEKALKDYRRRVNLPGFRQGHVPMGIIKKRFGKSLLADEINQLLDESIRGYVQEQKLDVLGSPMPAENKEETGNWDDPEDFTFFYDVALAPEFEVNISNKNSFEFTRMEVTEKMIDEQVENLTRRYGKLEDAQQSSEKDMLLGDFVELNENLEIAEGGIFHYGNISIEYLKDEETKKLLTGLKPGDHVNVDPRKVSSDDKDLARMLGIDAAQVPSVQGMFRFNVKEIKSMKPAEINQEFFDKVFGEGGVSSEEEMRNKIREELVNMYEADSEKLFKREVMKQLESKLKLDLPDDLLKRWIMMSNEKPISPEQLENDYPEYARGLRWSLIENKLIREFEVKVEYDELLAHFKDLIAGNFKQYGMPPPPDEELTNYAKDAMKNQDQVRSASENLYDRKVMAALREKAKVKEVTLPYEKFVEFAQQG